MKPPEHAGHASPLLGPAPRSAVARSAAARDATRFGLRPGRGQNRPARLTLLVRGRFASRDASRTACPAHSLHPKPRRVPCRPDRPGLRSPGRVFGHSPSDPSRFARPWFRRTRTRLLRPRRIRLLTWPAGALVFSLLPRRHFQPSPASTRARADLTLRPSYPGVRTLRGRCGPGGRHARHPRTKQRRAPHGAGWDGRTEEDRTRAVTCEWLGGFRARLAPRPAREPTTGATPTRRRHLAITSILSAALAIRPRGRIKRFAHHRAAWRLTAVRPMGRAAVRPRHTPRTLADRRRLTAA